MSYTRRNLSAQEVFARRLDFHVRIKETAFMENDDFEGESQETMEPVRYRKDLTPEELESLKILSIGCRSDQELSELYQVPVKKILSWRANDPIWSAAIKALRKKVKIKTQAGKYKGPKALDKAKVAELVTSGAEMTAAQLSERNRHLALQFAEQHLARALETGSNLPIESFGDVAELVNMSSKAGGWNAAPLQINVSAFSEMSPASVSTVIDMDDQDTEREAYFRS